MSREQLKSIKFEVQDTEMENEEQRVNAKRTNAESGDAARSLLEAYRDDEKSSMALANQIMLSNERLAANENKLMEERRSVRSDVNTLIQKLTRVIEKNADERREMKNKEAELYDLLRKSYEIRDELVVENSVLRAKVDELQKSVEDVFSAIRNNVNLNQSKE